METETGEWLECVVDKDYEIWSQEPFPIRRKGTDRIINEYEDDKGYVIANLNAKHYKKHRIIAQQFIPNPNNLPFIDHVDRNRANNRVCNLRWVSCSDNNKNKSSYGVHQYTFINELPETTQRLDAYNGHEFDGLFIDYENEKLYLFNGASYKELIPNRWSGNIYYRACDIEGKWRCLAHKVLFG